MQLSLDTTSVIPQRQCYLPPPQAFPADKKEPNAEHNKGEAGNECGGRAGVMGRKRIGRESSASSLPTIFLCAITFRGFSFKSFSIARTTEVEAAAHVISQPPF